MMNESITVTLYDGKHQTYYYQKSARLCAAYTNTLLKSVGIRVTNPLDEENDYLAEVW